ncbi:MAG TPA: hypothetical protein VLA03_01625, partial [Draconibacterium sp.]|nr:hypothetical protein [Draconibacterium sp.]
RKRDQQVKEMRSNVFNTMLKTRGWKYRAFLRYLRLFKFFAFAPLRGKFLESYYTLMRYLDDVVDGDEKLAAGYFNESDYIAEKIEFSKNPLAAKDDADNLMMYCFELAERFGEDFQAETKDILESLLFDAKRRNKWIIFPNEELMYHFHLLDIRGTIRATLKVFKDNPDKYKILEPLGIACRHQYNIEDFEADIAAGYINIPKEDCKRFDIKKEDFHMTSSPNIRAWLNHHAWEGLALLDEHRRIMPEGKFSLLERMTFKIVYEIPARKLFRKVITEMENLNAENSYE